MAVTKIRVSDVARKMGKSEKDLIFQLQSLGADITEPSAVLEPEVIQALITGKKLQARTRRVTQPVTPGEPPGATVRPPRPIARPVVPLGRPVVRPVRPIVRPPGPRVEPPSTRLQSSPVEERPPDASTPKSLPELARGDVAIICDSCGAHSAVPFKPVPGKPIYCRDCYNQRRRNATKARGLSSPTPNREEAGNPSDENREPPPERIADAELIAALRQLVRAQRRAARGDVFIVHGHDAVKHAISHFVSLLGLHPIMLDDRPNRGRTLIEKLEEHATTSFAVILLTPDDIGCKRDAEASNPRARQNVILELGYFIAKLGRDRVCALYVPGVELPSDIHGLLYVELDPAGAWKYHLQNELVDAGLPVNLETAPHDVA